MKIHYSDYKNIFNNYPIDMSKSKIWPEVDIPKKLYWIICNFRLLSEEDRNKLYEYCENLIKK